MSAWTQMVKDLKAEGMTYAQIGAVINLAPSTVGDLAAGRYQSPRADAAIALAKLHGEKCNIRTRSRKSS